MTLDFDLWRELISVIRKISVPLEWKKVDSHVDLRRYKKGQTPKGNKLAFRLNEAADEMAGKVRRQMNEPPEEHFFPESHVMVKCKGQFLYGNISAKIIDSIHSPLLQEYIRQKNGWDSQTFQMIDWVAMETYVKTLSGTQETNVIKLVHSWQNDGHQKSLHSEGEETAACPACGLYEDHFHFVRCKDSRMRQRFQELKDDFQKTHGGIHTALPIFQSFKSIIRALQTGTIPTRPTFLNDKLGKLTERAWKEQDKIGWSQIFLGRIT